MTTKNPQNIQNLFFYFTLSKIHLFFCKFTSAFYLSHFFKKTKNQTETAWFFILKIAHFFIWAVWAALILTAGIFSPMLTRAAPF
ncbi:hypothetical protein B2M23_12350 [Eubacterium limosum]|jgi:hypothetical protein|uniref:Uncharacterized protein n=1 Tax=Eubacterium limosum TaxID=1736 RepID=A0AAC9QVB8_EUBLI|nr:hypothetical protein B2M23_12350 [Eubacterium limosum]